MEWSRPYHKKGTFYENERNNKLTDKSDSIVDVTSLYISDDTFQTLTE
jgi:hypothetical protein